MLGCLSIRTTLAEEREAYQVSQNISFLASNYLLIAGLGEIAMNLVQESLVSARDSVDCLRPKCAP